MHELLFNELESAASLLNKSSHLAAALHVTKFIAIIVMYFSHTLLCYLSQT
jgi:hypothetical protein